MINILSAAANVGWLASQFLDNVRLGQGGKDDNVAFWLLHNRLWRLRLMSDLPLPL